MLSKNVLAASGANDNKFFNITDNSNIIYAKMVRKSSLIKVFYVVVVRFGQYEEDEEGENGDESADVGLGVGRKVDMFSVNEVLEGLFHWRQVQTIANILEELEEIVIVNMSFKHKLMIVFPYFLFKTVN